LGGLLVDWVSALSRPYLTVPMSQRFELIWREPG
jgi:hypothetical protein